MGTPSAAATMARVEGLPKCRHSHAHGAEPPLSLKPGPQAPAGQLPVVASQGAAQPGGHTKQASAKRGAHMPAAMQSAHQCSNVATQLAASVSPHGWVTNCYQAQTSTAPALRHPDTWSAGSRASFDGSWAGFSCHVKVDKHKRAS